MNKFLPLISRTYIPKTLINEIKTQGKTKLNMK